MTSIGNLQKLNFEEIRAKINRSSELTMKSTTKGVVHLFIKYYQLLRSLKVPKQAQFFYRLAQNRVDDIDRPNACSQFLYIVFTAYLVSWTRGNRIRTDFNSMCKYFEHVTRGNIETKDFWVWVRDLQDAIADAIETKFNNGDVTKARLRVQQLATS